MDTPPRPPAGSGLPGCRQGPGRGGQGAWCGAGLGGGHEAFTQLSLVFSVSLAPLPLPLPRFCPGFGRGQCRHTALTVGSALSLHGCPARQSWSLSPACVSPKLLCCVPASSPPGTPGRQSPEHSPPRAALRRAFLFPSWSPIVLEHALHCLGARCLLVGNWGVSSVPWQRA